MFRSNYVLKKIRCFLRLSYHIPQGRSQGRESDFTCWSLCCCPQCSRSQGNVPRPEVWHECDLHYVRQIPSTRILENASNDRISPDINIQADAPSSSPHPVPAAHSCCEQWGGSPSAQEKLSEIHAVWAQLYWEERDIGQRYFCYLPKQSTSSESFSR